MRMFWQLSKESEIDREELERHLEEMSPEDAELLRQLSTTEPTKVPTEKALKALVALRERILPPINGECGMSARNLAALAIGDS